MLSYSVYPTPTIPEIGAIVTMRSDGMSVELYTDKQIYLENSVLREIPIGTYYVAPPVDIDWTVISQRTEVGDGACVIVPFAFRRVSEPFNRYINTYDGKRLSRTMFALHGIHSIAHIYVPYRNAPFSECFVHFITHPNYPLVCGSETPVLQSVEDTAALVVPTWTVTTAATIAENGVNTVNIVSDKSYPATIYLEEVAGYAPKKRVDMVAGSATFDIHALGLRTGDQLRIKAGLRDYSGIADILVNVQ